MPVVALGSIMDTIRHNHHWYNIQMHKKLLRQARTEGRNGCVAALAVATPVVAVAMPEYHPPQVSRAGCCGRAFNFLKLELQANPLTKKCFPPSGDVATILTLCLVAAGLFLVARTVLGPIAGPGGTIFALMVLVMVALVGGLLIKSVGLGMHLICGWDVRMPPLLGMLLVGIVLKNVPYNFGQFGRAECFSNHTSGKFVDSINDLDAGVEEHLNFKRSISDNLMAEMLGGEDLLQQERMARSVAAAAGSPGDEVLSAAEKLAESCQPKFIGHDLDPLISVTLRSICLTVILLMAGLELDPVALWKLSGMVVRATFIPCFTEAVAAAALSHYILGFPWSVGLMLGFVLAAVSPAVIIPSLMNLSGRGYGVAKGIPTLVIAACSADDVVAISGFGIFLGITYASDDAPLTMLILHGPIEVVIGTSFGVFWGVLAQWIPNKDNKNVVFYRWLILFSGGLIAVFGAHHIHYEGAGGLATIIMAFLASMEWRKEGWGEHNPVSKIFTKMWIILEPVIFALIGTEIQIDKIDPATMGYGILVLCLALVIRMIGTFFAVSCGNLNFREKIFMAFAWLPKATVQAALGPIMLDRAKVTEDPDMISYGEQILTIAVMSILITAPLGAIGILGLGPHLLESNKIPGQEEGTAVVGGGESGSGGGAGGKREDGEVAERVGILDSGEVNCDGSEEVITKFLNLNSTMNFLNSGDCLLQEEEEEEEEEEGMSRPNTLSTLQDINFYKKPFVTKDDV